MNGDSLATMLARSDPMSGLFRRRGIPNLCTLGLAFAALGCTSPGERVCPDPLGDDCESTLTIQFPERLVGAYFLDLKFAGERRTALCNSPDDLETENNPVDLTCDSTSFTLHGEIVDLSNQITVSIVEDSNPIDLAGRQQIDLDTTTIAPNGPECDPICFVRTGRLRTQS